MTPPPCLAKAITMIAEENRIGLKRKTELPHLWDQIINARAGNDGPLVFPLVAGHIHAARPQLVVGLLSHLQSPPSEEIERVWPTLRLLTDTEDSFDLEAEYLLAALVCAAIEVTYCPRFTRDELIDRLEKIRRNARDLSDSLDWIDEYCALPNAVLWQSELGAGLSQMGVGTREIHQLVRFSPSLPKLLRLLDGDVVRQIEEALKSPQVRASRSNTFVTRFRELTFRHLLQRFGAAKHSDLVAIAHGVTLAAFWGAVDPSGTGEPLSFKINQDAARAQLRRILRTTDSEPN